MNQPWTRFLIVGLAALAIAFGVGLLLHKHAGRSDAPSAAGSSAQNAVWRFGFDFPKGQSLVYRLSFRSKQAASSSPALDRESGDQQVGGSSAFDGTISLTRRGERGGAQLIALRIEELSSYSLEAFGKPVIADTAEANKLLVGPEAILAMRADGRIEEVYFHPTASTLFKRHAQGIVSELQLKLCRSDDAVVCPHWDNDEATDAGRALMRYAVAGPFRLTATPKHYTTVSGLGEGADLSKVDIQHAGGKQIELAPDGYLKEIQHHTELVVREIGTAAPLVQSAQQFSLRLGSMRAADLVALPDLADWERQLAGELRIDPATMKRMLVQRVAGLTREELLDGIAARATGAIRRNDGWFTRATGLLLLEPDLCETVASLAQAQGSDQATRALVVDLLAGAGSPEAQRALRRFLHSGAAREGDWADTFQRVSFLKKPEPETVRLTIDTYKETRPAADSRTTTREHTASALTMGSMARALGDEGREAERDEIVGELRTQLREPRTDEDLAVTVRALGNAAAPSTLGELLALVAHPNPIVRNAVAVALRQFDTAEAITALLSLAADQVPAVGASAISSLRGKSLSGEQLSGLCRTLVNERADAVILPAIMTLVEEATQAPLTPRMECAARMVELPGHEDDGVRQRAGTFLERAAAAQ